MRQFIDQPTKPTSVMDQAAAVVTAATATALAAARQAAQVCGCARCRVAATHTERWAAGLLAGPRGSHAAVARSDDLAAVADLAT